MKKLRDVFRFLISLLLMFLIVILQFSLFTHIDFLKADFYKKTLDKGSYYSDLRKEINYGFKNLSMVTSIPEEVFQGSVNDNSIKELTEMNIDNTAKYMKYNGDSITNTMDRKIINENLNKYIDDYSKKNNIKVSADLTKQLQTTSDDAGKIIDNHVILFNIEAVAKYSEFQGFRKGIYNAYNNLYVFILAILVLIATLALLCRRRIHRTLLWVGSSAIPAALMVLIPAFLAVFFRIPYRFSIGNAYLNEALEGFTLGYIHFFITSGVIAFILGIGCLVTYVLMSKRLARTTKG